MIVVVVEFEETVVFVLQMSADSSVVFPLVLLKLLVLVAMPELKVFVMDVMETK